ncbi:hypothetical protein ONS95_004165 [Cadophora gregata]|uniref:uncharacterized protein n=1 Tax=Cadophora gregata TaxID=51156 RepID=UPI0026DD98DB|nr:uncharacterized protein ONS95_004165 [Cadophora gregata]KAK0105471.1 hypothetical protein ONS96_004856 [Cadophora gregata f. sp. sojae]KAK0105635.1 hypothetical protein ONS95_004165 [Cadophora gregata]
MAGLNHFNPKAGSKPYHSLFSNVTIVPPNTSLAYISTQWAADPSTGELVEGVEGDYFKQAQIIYQNIVAILKELGAELKDIVHRTVSFSEFNDDIGKAVVEGMMSSIPDEWKADAFAPSLGFNGPAIFHRPGMVYAVDIVVAVPNRK